MDLLKRGPGGILAACFLLAAVAGAGLHGIPTDSWVYDDVDVLKTSGLIRSMPSTSRPWTRDETERLVREADSIARECRSGPLQQDALDRLRTEFGIGLPGVDLKVGPRRPLVSIPVPVSDDARFDADLFGRAGGGRVAERMVGRGSVGALLANRPGTDFAFYERAEFTVFRPDTVDITDSSGTHVPGTRVHSWMNLATLQVEHAYLAFKIPWLRLEAGRDEFRWGPGYVSSLMLSDNAPSLDHVQLCASYSNFKFLAFTSYLSRWGEKHRFLSAQRLEVSLWHRVTLGGALMSVYSWDSLQTRNLFGMMNPLIPAYLSVANSGHDDNFLVGWDAVVHLPPVKVYGQLFLDNFEFKQKPSMPPNAVGWQAGAYCTPRWPVEARFEYARVNAFTYYHRIHHIMYEQYGVPLGHEIGPDADQWFARVAGLPLDGLRVFATGTFTRRGYFNRGDFVRRSWHAGQPLPERFPAEANGEQVEKTWRVGPGVEWWFGRDLRIEADAAWWYSENYGGAPENRSGFDFSVGVEYRY